MKHEGIEIEIAKELTLKAMEHGLIRLLPVEAENSESAGKRVAAFYNAVLENLSLQLH